MTQNFNVPLNSSSVPLQMFALSEGQTFLSWPLVHKSMRSEKKKQTLLSQREESHDIIYYIVSVEKEQHTALDCLSWRAFIVLHSLVDIKKKKKKRLSKESYFLTSAQSALWLCGWSWCEC